MSWEIDLAEVTCALADALDLVGVNVVQHGKRVAFMSLEISRQAGIAGGDAEDLFYAALLHDAGVSSTEVHHRILASLEWEGSTAHCIAGYELLRGFAPFAGVAEIVRHHHRRWDEGPLGGDASQMRLLANCVFLADRVDALVLGRTGAELLLARPGVRQAIIDQEASCFARDLVAAFLRASRAEAFWLTLEPRHLERFVAERAREQRRRPVDFGELRELAAIFARIVDAKSPFTAEHSLGVARLARLLGELAGLDAATCDSLELSGLLHDLGKLRVPDAVLEKPSALDEEEFAAVAAHTFETFQIVSRISVLRDVAETAGLHHERLTGDGYPFRRSGSGIPLTARIVAVADVFQALTQERPYRKRLEPGAAMLVLEGMAAAGRLDRGVVRTLAANLTACHRAASVPSDSAPEVAPTQRPSG